jgi:hypothetical protein
VQGVRGVAVIDPDPAAASLRGEFGRQHPAVAIADVGLADLCMGSIGVRQDHGVLSGSGSQTAKAEDQRQFTVSLGPFRDLERLLQPQRAIDERLPDRAAVNFRAVAPDVAPPRGSRLLRPRSAPGVQFHRAGFKEKPTLLIHPGSEAAVRMQGGPVLSERVPAIRRRLRPGERVEADGGIRGRCCDRGSRGFRVAAGEHQNADENRHRTERGHILSLQVLWIRAADLRPRPLQPAGDSQDLCRGADPVRAIVLNSLYLTGGIFCLTEG